MHWSFRGQEFHEKTETEDSSSGRGTHAQEHGHSQVQPPHEDPGWSSGVLKWLRMILPDLAHMLCTS